MTDFEEIKTIVFEYLREFIDILMKNFTGWNILIQLAVVAGIIVVAFPLTKIINLGVRKIKIAEDHHKTQSFMTYVRRFTSPLLIVVLLKISSQILANIKFPAHFVNIVLNIYLIWLVIKLTTLIIDNLFVKKVIQTWFWIVASLSILGIWTPTKVLLEKITLKIGEVHIALYSVFNTFLLAIFLVWLIKKLLALVTIRLQHSKSLRPTMQVLLGKIITFLLYVVAFFMLVSSLGINMTTLSIFTGGIGLGIGIGLQKIFSNLLSGFILLLDDSIKPGDVIEMDETFGAVKEMSSRYTSIVTPQGKEILIPNEELISQSVVNWSHSNKLIRVDANVGVSYNSDIHKVKEILEVAPLTFDRVLKRPKPEAMLVEFGDSSVNFQVQFWIHDPQKGIVNVRSKVLLAIWDAFLENDIEIPFPQQDLHIKSSVLKLPEA
ncbi:MAG: mechanosensitive ion channel [Candidatus Zophobacter franzmannii]|jgi:small-conductance mechanosensitive channel|nr:mechanosensitive ion channel [Candidatus Zophobacter franzmannii]